eukprot:6194756-Pleurochrysis_carterae.AAC.3
MHAHATTSKDEPAPLPVGMQAYLPVLKRNQHRTLAAIACRACAHAPLSSSSSMRWRVTCEISSET